MLTQAHVRALRDHPSPVVRADIAAAVSHDFAAGTLSPDEANIAEQILEGLALDMASVVRQALADNIRNCPFLPHNIAITLAHDLEESIALPVIEYSPILRDADLISLIRTRDANHQLAVARRESLSETVSDALVETDNVQVVQTLLSNDGAEISDDSLVKVAIRFQGDTDVQELLIDRSLLPFSVCGVLMESVSMELQRKLVEKHHIPNFMAVELVTLGREHALADLLPSYDSEPSETLAFTLQQKNLLTPMLLLRTLCVGDMRFFAGAMSVLAGVPLRNTRTLLFDSGNAGFPALYRKARLPETMFSYFRIAVDALLQGYLKRNRSAYTSFIVEQFVRTDCNLSPGTLDHVLTELSHRFAMQETKRTAAPAKI